ncbi:MAG: hypothetical protein QOK49_3783, partial [Baekduia sp.]|nr:hypothetical protein [Baekduia sp.]
MVLATFACLMRIPGYFSQPHAGFFMHNLGWQTIAATYERAASRYLGARASPRSCTCWPRLVW